MGWSRCCAGPSVDSCPPSDGCAAPKITRFKGLGEISPKEFGQFIGADMRLVKVSVKSMSAVPRTLEFYMGKNTPERREYIMENLV